MSKHCVPRTGASWSTTCTSPVRSPAVATVKLGDGFVCEAEVHWYEASGIGKREMKIKRLAR